MICLRGQFTQIPGNPVLFNGGPVDLSRMPDVPLETTVEAAIDDGVLIDWQYDLNSWPARDKIPFRIAVAWDDDRHDVDEFIKEAHDRLVQICQNRWDIRITVYDIAGMDMGGRDLETFDFRAFRQMVEDDGFDATHHILVSGWGTGNCGRARAGGRQAMARPNCGPETFVHELMHNGANRHCHVIHSGIPGDVYGEIGVLMARSTGGARDDITTPHLFQMQLIEENNIKELVAGESGLFFLVQGSADPLSLAVGEDKAVMCLRAGPIRRLMVSYHDGTVRIHRPGSDYSTLFRQTTMLRRLSEGESVLIDGTFVEFLGAENGAAMVSVDNGDEEQDGSALPDFPRWAAPADAHPIDITRNGLWRNPAWAGSGQGVQVCYDEDENELVVHWLGWSRLGHKPQYRWMRATIEGNAARGVLMTSEGGEPVESGQAIIYWYDDGQAIMRAYDRTLGRFAFPLTRLGAGIPHPLNGYYGLGGGEGLSLSVLETGQLVGFWLRYTTDARGKVEQEWRIVEGLVGQSLDVSEVAGGMLGTPVQITKKHIGSMTIEDGVALIGGERRAMERLA